MSEIAVMDFSKCLCYNEDMNGWYALLTFACGFVVAQLWKFVAGLISGRKQKASSDWKTAIGYLMRSGGMPSGHSASMAGLTTYLGLMCGFDSAIFALAVATTLIVIYDAVHVRYAVGEQGKALNKLLEKDNQQSLPVVEGHTVPQVAVGVVLGILIGVGMWFLTRLG